jgi:photosystem II stability/assembly factor-like uncharacterized protein
VDPSDPLTVYVATEVEGVQKSTDGGMSWSPAGTGIALQVLALAVDAAQSSVVYAGTSGDGVYRSENGGISWRTDLGPKNAKIQSIVIHPTTPNIVYASSESGVYRSTDAGLHWINIGLSEHDLGSIILDEVYPIQVYTGAQDGGIFGSPDGGSLWTLLSDGLLTIPAVNALAVVSGPSTSLVYAATQAGGVLRMTATPPTTTTSTISPPSTSTTSTTSTTTTTRRPTTTTSSAGPSTTTTSSTTTTVATESSTTTSTPSPTTVPSPTSTTSSSLAPSTTSVPTTSTTSTTQAPPREECSGTQIEVLRCLLAGTPQLPACAAETPPDGVQRRLRQANRLVDRAAATTRPQRARRVLKMAAKRATRAGAIGLAAGAHGRISRDCAEALLTRFSSIAQRAQSLAECDPGVSDGCLPAAGG